MIFFRRFSALLILTVFISCTPKPGRINFYHGQNPLDVSIKVTHISRFSVEFNIRGKFNQSKYYHLILDENEERIAEGWYPKTPLSQISGLRTSYTIQLKLKPGQLFQPDKQYRLCIGTQPPESVLKHSSSYKCLLDYEFSLGLSE